MVEIGHFALPYTSASKAFLKIILILFTHGYTFENLTDIQVKNKGKRQFDLAKIQQQSSQIQILQLKHYHREAITGRKA